MNYQRAECVTVDGELLISRIDDVSFHSLGEVKVFGAFSLASRSLQNAITLTRSPLFHFVHSSKSLVRHNALQTPQNVFEDQCKALSHRVIQDSRYILWTWMTLSLLMPHPLYIHSPHEECLIVYSRTI